LSRIVLFGASGLIGSSLAPLLRDHELTVVGRRTSGIPGERIAPVADWPSVIAELRPDVVISTLGTTIAKAGSREAFAAIDYDAIVAVATAAKAAGASQFLMVSSVGASAPSVNFYLSTKGRTEASVIELGFDRLDIFRPGLLVGHRTDDPRRGERLGIVLSPLTNALTPRRFDRYRAIAATQVAAAIARAVGAPAPGVHIYHNREMLEPARKLA
jgi:uncharacterized protein YbjT (DUF2867 family)